MNKIEEKEKLNNALKEMKIFSDARQAQKKVKENIIGFEKEKERFLESIRYYILFQGKLRPRREITCYSGAPGVGKTTFVQTLSDATDRPLKLVPCAGLANPSDYSILGSESKPSLVAWAIMEGGCKNPIILLDELEKVTDEKIQADLIKLFEIFKDKGVYKDPYFQREIDLKYLDFFAAVNYDEKLATKLKDKVNLIRLLGYNEKQKMKILKRKKNDMQEKYELEKSEVEKVLSDEILEFLIKEWIQEKGVRKLEQAIHKTVEEHVYAKKTGKQAFQGDKRKWVEKNILPFRESFQANWRHYLLFASFGTSLILLIAWIFNKFLLKPIEKEKKEKQRREDE